MTARKHNLVSSVPQGSSGELSPSEPKFLAVGRVLRPHGLQGELRVEIHTDYPERFALRKRIYLGPAETSPHRTWDPCETQGNDSATGSCGRTTSDPCAYIPYALEGCRFHQSTVLLKLKGIDDRHRAETLREQWVWIPIEDAVPLEEGECYLYQVLGLRVVTVDGEELGKVTEIIETGANLVYIAQGVQGEILLPDTDEVIVQVDVPAGQMIVQLIEGLR